MLLSLGSALPVSAAALEQKLTAADGAADDDLGRSVAIEGDTAVAGAPLANAGRGAVYVFTRFGDSWIQTAKLTAADGAVDDRLGDSVAIAGETVVAGAYGDDIGADAGQGSLYTFARTGAAARTETAKLTASDGAATDLLGFSVAIVGDTIVAGAPSDMVGADAGQGSVYTFARTGAAARTETAKLTATDGAAFDLLGRSVAIEGDTIVAGAPLDDVGADGDQGSAYTFARTGAARTETAKLSATDGAPEDLFGWSVAVEGDTIVAGAPFDMVGADADQGSAYTFTRTGPAARTEAAKLTAADGAAGDRLGDSVALNGNAIVAGAPEDEVGGSASIFFAPAPVRPGPPGPGPNPGPCANSRRGTGAAETLLGTPAGDAIFGLGGSDLISGLAGEDCLFGGTGNDRLRGDGGDDRAAGGSGRDRLLGGGDRDSRRRVGVAGRVLGANREGVAAIGEVRVAPR